ncbi:MAG: TfoX/Sxy family protein [Proteobacteria bacterium]|nr:TfoX/Sxy family protein [Pseudomonadota bacterium]
MPHIPANLQKIVEKAAPLEIELRCKPMFGGIGAYAFGRMCMSLSDVGLALKLGEAERQALLRLKGAKPLQYAPDAPPSKSYVVVPDAMLSDLKMLQSWIARSADFVRTQEPKHRKK